MRKQFYNTVKKKREELKKVEDIVTSYSIVRHDVRFTLRHNKELLWQVGWQGLCLMYRQYVKQKNAEKQESAVPPV